MNSSRDENYFSGVINKGVKISVRSYPKLLCVVGGGGGGGGGGDKPL